MLGSIQSTEFVDTLAQVGLAVLFFVAGTGLISLESGGDPSAVRPPAGSSHWRPALALASSLPRRPRLPLVDVSSPAARAATPASLQ